MCDDGAMIQSEDEHGNAVFLCGKCGGVFTVLHHCDVHMVCAVEGDLYVLGDMNSECAGVVIEGRGMNETRHLMEELQRENVRACMSGDSVSSESVIGRCRDAAAWN